MKDRIRALRKALDMTQKEFAEKIGLKRNSVASYEIGKNYPMDTVIKSICREFNVNEDWLRTGEGEMFIQLPEEDEVAAYVSDLLEDDGENPLYLIIKEIMHTYNEVSPKSQEILCDFSKRLLDNLNQKKES
ncbi:helix-turn-helix transcriptional regulator [Lachnospiraceae bacterium 56-18]